MSANEQYIHCLHNAMLWKGLHDHLDTPTIRNEPRVFTSISDAISLVEGVVPENNNTYVQILVCGSFYLVGGVLKLLGYNTDTLLQNGP